MILSTTHSKFFLVAILIVGLNDLYGSDKASSEQGSEFSPSGKRATTEHREKQKKQKSDVSEDEISLHSAPEATSPEEQYLNLTLEQRQRARLLTYATICGRKRKKSPRASRISALAALTLYDRWAEQLGEDLEQEAKNHIALNTLFNSEDSERLFVRAQEDLEEFVEALKAEKTKIEEALTVLTEKKHT